MNPCLQSSVYLDLLLSYSDPVDPEEIISDPVAAYKLLRQLRNELINIVKHIQPSFYQCNKYQDELELLEIPQLKDLDGAASGLIRLQEIYKLYPKDIMKEMLLSADEAYHVGLVAYDEDKFQHAFLWFWYSLDRLTEYSTTTEKELLLYLISSAYHFGSLPVAIYFNKQLLNLDPTDEEVRDQLNRLLRFQRKSNPDIFTLNTESRNYAKLCRGELDKRLSRSKVYQDGWDTVSQDRVSQSVFLQDDPVATRVSQRIADATGLSMETAESLLVQNYGIGGRFEPHYDALETGVNDRIATFLIYMSDVGMGGATVFPDIGVATKPKKGSAVFWYNLHKNGELDLNTRHAGCPVLVGNKWVANKWIHEFGQEFKRPCSLSEWE
uniref:procollagen-proline 4-dioxygenase n=1 Tax=Cyprinus carpio carpio TaxID=630221 RepID=A0A8C0Y3M7_CYPCA